MTAYRSTVKGSVHFDGDAVAFELKRISYEAAVGLRDASPTAAAALVREHVLALDVKDADGAPVPIDTVFRDFYFVSLVSALTRELMATGVVPRDKADPSGGSSPTSSPGGSSPQE